MYVRKEALLSSQIEGTQSSLSDLLLFENDEIPLVPLDDVQEVSNYVVAMNYGLKRLDEGFPLSLRLLREIHDVLLKKGRGSSKQPGEFRRTQNWIGGTRPRNVIYADIPHQGVKIARRMTTMEHVTGQRHLTDDSALVAFQCLNVRDAAFDVDRRWRKCEHFGNPAAAPTQHKAE